MSSKLAEARRYLTTVVTKMNRYDRHRHHTYKHALNINTRSMMTNEQIDEWLQGISSNTDKHAKASQYETVSKEGKG